MFYRFIDMYVLTIQSFHNEAPQILTELELIVKAYYEIIDDCKGNDGWIRKLEDDLGVQLSHVMGNIEEDHHDELMAASEYFKRFVSKRLQTGFRQVEVL
jgi:hypothetical protein